MYSKAGFLNKAVKLNTNTELQPIEVFSLWLAFIMCLSGFSLRSLSLRLSQSLYKQR